MSIIKLATNFKQFMRPLQRNKLLVSASTIFPASIGGLAGAATAYEYDPKKGGNKKVGNPLLRGLTGAAIGATVGGIAGHGAAINSDRHKKIMREIDLDIARSGRYLDREFKKNNERFKKSFEEDFKRSFKNDFNFDFENDDFFKNFGKSNYQRHSYGGGSRFTPPPPKPKHGTQEDISGFFKKHHNIDHTNVKTKAQAKKLYRQGAQKHHPDAGGSEEAFKKYQGDWEKVENSNWFEKLASYRDLLK